MDGVDLVLFMSPYAGSDLLQVTFQPSWRTFLGTVSLGATPSEAMFVSNAAFEKAPKNLRTHRCWGDHGPLAMSSRFGCKGEETLMILYFRLWKCLAAAAA